MIGLANGAASISPATPKSPHAAGAISYVISFSPGDEVVYPNWAVAVWTISTVPLPPAGYLFMTALLGLIVLKRKL